MDTKKPMVWEQNGSSTFDDGLVTSCEEVYGRLLTTIWWQSMNFGAAIADHWIYALLIPTELCTSLDLALNTEGRLKAQTSLFASVKVTVAAF